MGLKGLGTQALCAARGGLKGNFEKKKKFLIKKKKLV
jgi:hypothetical protein